MPHILTDFKAFLDASPTSWHAVREIGNRLSIRDFHPLNEEEKWDLELGQKYFVSRGGALCAFALPKHLPTQGIILASHTDSPALKLKPHPTYQSQNMTQLGVEVYGSPLLSSWLNRDLGIAVHGDVLGNRLNYAFGLVNGVSDGGNISTGTEFDGRKEFTARLFATPFVNVDSALKGLGFGVAATYTDSHGERNLNFTDTSAADATRNGLPSYLTDGQNTFFRYSSATVADGQRLRISPQAYFYTGPVGVIAEYATVRQDVSLATGGSPTAGGAGSNTVITPNTNKKLSHSAWQIAVSYILTSEDASFRAVKPKRDFDLGTGWGAWELVARYSEINLDDDTFRDPTGTSFIGGYANLSESAKSAHSWTAGVNWYLNQNAKIALNYEHTTFDGGAGDGILPINAAGTNVRDRKEERAFLTRLQLAF